MWETELFNYGSDLAIDAEAAGWEPVSVAVCVDGVPTVLYRRRKPAPLQPCEGCVFRVDTGATYQKRAPDGTFTTEDYTFRYECHRYPPSIVRKTDGDLESFYPDANGLGCGERQEGGK